MVEIEGLKVMISAEVKAAIENMQKIQVQMKKTEDIAKKMKEKEEAALKKWKAGWLTISTTALASLYALAKTSAYMSLWFDEATGSLQYFSDSAMEPLSPIAEEVNKILWKLSDVFAALPASIRGAVGAILILAGVLGGILATLALIDAAFGTTFAVGLLTYLGTALAGIKTWLLGLPALFSEAFAAAGTASGTALLLGIAAGIGVGITVVWLMEKLGIFESLTEYGRNLRTAMPNIFNLVEIITAPLGALGSVFINIVKGQIDQIIPDLRRIFRNAIWTAFNVFPETFRWINEQGKGFREWAGTNRTYLGWTFPTNEAAPPQQTGTAFIPSTGLYTLHRGESVIPRGKSTSEGSNTINFSPTVNITGTTINSAMDVRQLAAQLTSYWRDDLQRYSRLGVT